MSPDDSETPSAPHCCGGRDHCLGRLQQRVKQAGGQLGHHQRGRPRPDQGRADLGSCTCGVEHAVAATTAPSAHHRPGADQRPGAHHACVSKASGNLTVWVDAVRLPVAKAYQAAHPNVKMTIVTFDGDGNGATTLQAKIQLWNRTGKGWPDVIFSEQVNDPVWMAQKPFEFAAPVKGLIPDNLLAQWPAPSTAQCTVNGVQVCVQDNLAQVVLWVNKKLMDQFGYKTPTTWQEWAAIGREGCHRAPRLHHRQHR